MNLVDILLTRDISGEIFKWVTFDRFETFCNIRLCCKELAEFYRPHVKSAGFNNSLVLTSARFYEMLSNGFWEAAAALYNKMRIDGKDINPNVSSLSHSVKNLFRYRYKIIAYSAVVKFILNNNLQISKKNLDIAAKEYFIKFLKLVNDYDIKDDYKYNKTKNYIINDFDFKILNAAGDGDISVDTLLYNKEELLFGHYNSRHYHSSNYYLNNFSDIISINIHSLLMDKSADAELPIFSKKSNDIKQYDFLSFSFMGGLFSTKLEFNLSEEKKENTDVGLSLLYYLWGRMIVNAAQKTDWRGRPLVEIRQLVCGYSAKDGGRPGAEQRFYHSISEAFRRRGKAAEININGKIINLDDNENILAQVAIIYEKLRGQLERNNRYSFHKSLFINFTPEQFLRSIKSFISKNREENMDNNIFNIYTLCIVPEDDIVLLYKQNKVRYEIIVPLFINSVLSYSKIVELVNYEMNNFILANRDRIILLRMIVLKFCKNGKYVNSKSKQIYELLKNAFNRDFTKYILSCSNLNLTTLVKAGEIELAELIYSAHKKNKK